MSPFAPQVVGAAAVLAGPVFYQAVIARTAPLDFALTRFLIIWVVTWVVVSLVVDLLFPTRLETERRVRDLLLAEREVRKAVEEAEAEEARAAHEAADEPRGIGIFDAVADSDDEPADRNGRAEPPPVPTPRTEPADVRAPRDEAVSGTRPTS